MGTLLLAGAAFAEMSGDDYRSTARPLDAAARRQLETQLQHAREREAREAAEREQAALAEAARRARAEAARPAGERLAHARCTGCHTLAVIEGNGRGLWGWRWTVERMRWWHGAKLTGGEAAELARWLHQAHGPQAGASP
jgi:mono/diheme cytochrome c family protein